MKVRRDESGMPTASGFRLYRCTHCPHIHIALKDEDDEVFAVMVISNAQAMAIGIEGEFPDEEERVQ